MIDFIRLNDTTDHGLLILNPLLAKVVFGNLADCPATFEGLSVLITPLVEAVELAASAGAAATAKPNHALHPTLSNFLDIVALALFGAVPEYGPVMFGGTQVLISAQVDVVRLAVKKPDGRVMH
ncbi:hypothetical protein [Paraburkholderia dilworthii]|uniref:hypothetical protein n=1 Tax=Paraburkholderia dilworthii TaxID=948106 RepID=UPI00040F592F|nr:hypothetical protein [Paraburkholderia dilworthii]